MSRNASIDLDFGDGTYTFRLAWGELANLQEACDAGPYVIFQRLNTGEWKMNDIREVIRYGLIGGGMAPSDALKIIRAYVEDRPPLETIMFAKGILSAGLMGAPDEPVGEQEAANPTEANLTTSPTESFDLPPSTETVPS